MWPSAHVIQTVLSTLLLPARDSVLTFFGHIGNVIGWWHGEGNLVSTSSQKLDNGTEASFVQPKSDFQYDQKRQGLTLPADVQITVDYARCRSVDYMSNVIGWWHVRIT